MTGRHYSTGSVTDADGNVRAYLHIKRLRALSESTEVHCRHAPMLQAAAEAMEILAKRNQRMGRELGARFVARFDENTDYRAIVQAIASIPRPEVP